MWLAYRNADIGLQTRAPKANNIGTLSRCAACKNFAYFTTAAYHRSR